jgi:hypothetical protein
LDTKAPGALEEYVLPKVVNGKDTYPHRIALKAMGFTSVWGELNPRTGKPTFIGWATTDKTVYDQGYYMVTGVAAGNVTPAARNSNSVGGDGSQGEQTSQSGENEAQGAEQSAGGSGNNNGTQSADQNGNGNGKPGDGSDDAQPNEAPEAKSYDEEQVFEQIDKLNSKQVQAVARLAREATGNKFIDTGRNDLAAQKAHLKTMASAEQLAEMIQQVLGEAPQAKAPEAKPQTRRPMTQNDFDKQSFKTIDTQNDPDSQKPDQKQDDEQSAIEKAVAALNEALVAEKNKAPKAPDEDRIREIAREEAGALDQKLGEAITSAIHEAAKNVPAPVAQAPAVPAVIRVQIAQLPQVDATGMHPRATLVAALLHAGLNVCVVGPAGVGKTHMAGDVFKLLNIPFAGGISLSGGISESHVNGWLIPIGEGRYLPAPFVTAYEGGGGYLLDEVDAADPNMLLSLNQALANDGFFIASRAASGLDPFVKRSKQFACLSGANTFLNGNAGGFTARNKQDGAFRDRQIFVPVNYDKAYEARLFGCPIPADAEAPWSPGPVWTEQERPLWGAWLWAVRDELAKKANAQSAAYTFGTRCAHKIIACRSVGVSPAQTAELLFAGWNPTTIAGLGELAQGPKGVK